MTSYMRQTDLYDPERDGGQVTVIGCGGIGSVAAIALAKLGIPKMTLIDSDMVEEHNLPNQFFEARQLFTLKVEALGDLIEAMRGADGIDLDLYPQRVTADGPEGWHPNGIVVSGLDSMAARVEVWERVRKQISVPLYLDARLGGGRIVLYATNPNVSAERKQYEESLHYTDEEAREDPCTGRAIIDVGFSAAALITRAVRKHLTGQPLEPVVIHNQETFLSVKAEIPDRVDALFTGGE